MSEADQVQEFEDRRWSGGDQIVAWRHQACAALVGLEPVVDVGGGDGLLLRMLRSRGLRELRMVDLSPVAVEKAGAAGFVADVADLTQPLPYEDDAFGTICALDVLEHLRDPLPPLREMARVAREVIVAVPNFNYVKGRLEMMVGRIPFQSRPQRGHAYWINYDNLRRLLDEAGLRVLEWRFEPSTRLGPLGPRMAAAWPRVFAVSFAVRAVKVRS